MKKKLLSCFALSLLITPALAYDAASFMGGVLCTDNQKICVVGKYRLSTNGSEPLQVGDGVICTPDGRMCTNGFYVLRTNKTIYN